MDHEDTLEFPAFLRRERGKKADLKALFSQPDWVGFHKEQPVQKKAPALFVDDRQAPVQVNIRQKSGPPLGLASYESLAAFEAAHDYSMYPLVRYASNKEITLVLCSAKPWAPKPGEGSAKPKAKRAPAPAGSPPSAGAGGKRPPKLEGGGSKKERLLAMLREGTTMEAMLAMTGWAYCAGTAGRAARAAGLQVYKEKQPDGSFWYQAR